MDGRSRTLQGQQGSKNDLQNYFFSFALGFAARLGHCAARLSLKAR
jgi:hypothetical protein